MGAVIGALVIIGLGVAAGIFYYKKYYTKSMRTNATPSPPPSPAPLYKSSPPPVFGAYNTHFSMTPPPYRAVQTPTKDKLYPKVEKWTENELKPVHAPLSVINDIKVEGASNVVVQEEKVGDVKKLEDMLETPQRSKTTITIGSKLMALQGVL